jgi:hypothetical protein
MDSFKTDKDYNIEPCSDCIEVSDEALSEFGDPEDAIERNEHNTSGGGNE